MLAALLILAVFLAVLLRALSLGVLDYIRDARLAERIGRIGVDQRLGSARLLTDKDITERKR